MAGPRLHHRVQDALVDEDRFMDQVRAEAADLKREIRSGTFDNPQANVGLEYETYGVDEADASLKRVPRPLLDLIGFGKELGLHNAELHTHPMPLSEYGLRATRAELQARLHAAEATTTRTEGIQLVADGIWTIPPTGETALDYLLATVEREGVLIGTNLSKSLRYHGLANGAYQPRFEIDAPHVSLEGRTAGAESLITSIQPHYQVPSAGDLPVYFRYALRIAGPLLALGVNSPFFPPELYDEGATPEVLLSDGWAEHRISVFETSLNPRYGPEKVTFPSDIERVEDAVDMIAEDPVLVPMEVTERGRYDDRFAHLRHKHGTCWRWVRPVFEGGSESSANVRIEFRPLPNQPTVSDYIAFLALFAGLVKALPHRDHPVADLSWETARENFYTAMRDGLDADFRWITAEGDETTDHADIFPELFDVALEGLAMREIPREIGESTLRPLRERYERGVTPASWKRAQFEELVASGADLTEAIYHTSREYVTRQRETLIEGSFLDWLD
ncbi:MAG: hypothetical protein ABEJ71_01625 [Halodesulfurarchaeum sp.]